MEKNDREILVLGIIMIVLYFLFTSGCATEPFCTCEIETDGNPDHITFVVSGCHYCCWAATVLNCDTRQVDSIGEAYLQYNLENDSKCEYENADWYYLTGKLK